MKEYYIHDCDAGYDYEPDYPSYREAVKALHEIVGDDLPGMIARGELVTSKALVTGDQKVISDYLRDRYNVLTVYELHRWVDENGEYHATQREVGYDPAEPLDELDDTVDRDLSA